MFALGLIAPNCWYRWTGPCLPWQYDPRVGVVVDRGMVIPVRCWAPTCCLCSVERGPFICVKAPRDQKIGYGACMMGLASRSSISCTSHPAQDPPPQKPRHSKRVQKDDTMARAPRTSLVWSSARTPPYPYPPSSPRLAAYPEVQFKAY